MTGGTKIDRDMLKPSDSSNSLDSTNNATGPTEPARISTDRSWWNFTRIGVVPAAIFDAGSTVLGCILVAVNDSPPFLADQFRVNQDIDLLTVKERLCVEVSVSCERIFVRIVQVETDHSLYTPCIAICSSTIINLMWQLRFLKEL